MARVAITRPLPEDAERALRGAGHEVWVNPENLPLPRAQLVAELARSAGAITLLNDRVDEDLLAAAPGLRVVANYAVGYDNFDLDACTRRGVLAANTPDVLTDATADIAFALLLTCARRVVEADAYVRGGRFKLWGPRLFLGADLAGRALGIVGLGRIGQAMARRARGFDMTILYHQRRRDPAAEAELGAGYRDLDALAAEADFITLHCPLTAETHHLIDERRLALMRPGAILINTARGPVVDEAALVRALRDRRIAGAGLDVYEREPELAPGLAGAPNTVLLPHIGSATTQTRSRMAQIAAENVLAALAGERPPNLLNPAAFDRAGRRSPG
jgi:glyoxylate reductase